MTKKSSKPRLPTKASDVRELYLRSGNQCAFPGCDARLINSIGKFVAQLCHIEGLGVTAARFNNRLSADDLRKPENLLFMCYPHHIETNDEKTYSVERMREIKKQHEAKFSDIPRTILESISDHTKNGRISRAKTLARLNKIQGWGQSPEELAVSLVELNEFADRLPRVPVPTRELLSIVAQRVERPPGINMTPCVGVHEIKAATGLCTNELLGHLRILEKYGFTADGFPDDFGLPTIELRDLKSGWPIWEDLRKVADVGKFSLEDIIVELGFSLLD